ncbi:PIN domain-containing protein [Gordonia mangrovi]|uniref:PIN domain-containing protein n=1 Tax=Gordonia mangrovi TaxID=2665643 RepID=UPI001F4584EF|nr:PIN domain-containing protein [Gordonia mangrovi]UVF79014.1 PIN domain-containing protein [Gordonia mangrovi]
MALSAITVAELHVGTLVAKDATSRAERLRRLLIIERSFDALPVDEAVAAASGKVAAAVFEAGRQPRPRSLDLLIAATAHAHRARLYTRNPSDFVGIDELVPVVPV